MRNPVPKFTTWINTIVLYRDLSNRFPWLFQNFLGLFIFPWLFQVFHDRTNPAYWILSRRKWETRDQKMQMSWRPLSKKPGLPYPLSSATNWSPPCHAGLRQKLKQKEPLPSIEYIYSKLAYFPEGQQFIIFFIGLMKYSNLLRVNWWGFIKCEPKPSQLKEPKT